MFWLWFSLLIFAYPLLRLLRRLRPSSPPCLPDHDLRHRAVLITGCDSGFGAALARRLASRGVPVFAGCLTQAGVERLDGRGGSGETGSGEGEKLEGGVRALRLDVTDRESVEGALRVVQDTLKNNPNLVLWGLVSNAGVIGPFLPIELTAPDDFATVTMVNYLGAVRVVKAFLPLVVRARGRVVATTSIQGLVPGPSLGAYTASKFALHGFFKVLQMEMQLFKTGVSVSVIQPSGFKTELLNSRTTLLQKSIDALPIELRERYGEDYFEYILQPLNPKQYQVSADLSPVVQCFEDAIFSPHPQADYFVGPFCRTLYRLYQWLPERAFNAVMPRIYSVATPASVQKRMEKKRCE